MLYTNLLLTFYAVPCKEVHQTQTKSEKQKHRAMN